MTPHQTPASDPRPTTRRFGSQATAPTEDAETAELKRRLTDRLQQTCRDLAATGLRYSRGTYQLSERLTLRVRSTPYGFDSEGVLFVPIAMAYWAERQITEDELHRSRLIACHEADLASARALPSSPFLEQCLPSSRLVKVGDDLVRAKGGKILVDRFNTRALDATYPIIWVEPHERVMVRIRRFALEINQGQRPMTLQFE